MRLTVLENKALLSGAREGFCRLDKAQHEIEKLSKAGTERKRGERNRARGSGSGRGWERLRRRREELEGDSDSNSDSDKQPESLCESFQPSQLQLAVIPSLDTLHDSMWDITNKTQVGILGNAREQCDKSRYRPTSLSSRDGLGVQLLGVDKLREVSCTARHSNAGQALFANRQPSSLHLGQGRSGRQP
jgi:hypothetical protein